MDDSLNKLCSSAEKYEKQQWEENKCLDAFNQWARNEFWQRNSYKIAFMAGWEARGKQ